MERILKFCWLATLLFLFFPTTSLAIGASKTTAAHAENLAIRKWDAEALKRVHAATTLPQLLIALNFTREESEAREIGNRKWSTLFSEALFNAKDRSETRAILEKARSEDERWNAAVVAGELFGNRIFSEIVRDSYGDSKRQKEWDTRSLKMVVDAESLQDIQMAFAAARNGSPARRLAVIKANKFLPVK